MIRELSPRSHLLDGSKKTTDGAGVGDDVTTDNQDSDGGHLVKDDWRDTRNNLRADDASDGRESALANDRPPQILLNCVKHGSTEELLWRRWSSGYGARL